MIGVALAIAVAGCGVEEATELTWNERLAEGDTTLCAERELTASVIDSFARQAAESTPLFGGAIGRAWEQEKAYFTFEKVSATGFKPEIQELTCKGVLGIGDEESLITFMVRPSSALADEIVFETEDLSPVIQLLMAVQLAVPPEAATGKALAEDAIEKSYDEDAAAADAAMAEAEANVAAAEAAVAEAAAEADAAVEEPSD